MSNPARLALLAILILLVLAVFAVLLRRRHSNSDTLDKDLQHDLKKVLQKVLDYNVRLFAIVETHSECDFIRSLSAEQRPENWIFWYCWEGWDLWFESVLKVGEAIKELRQVLRKAGVSLALDGPDVLFHIASLFEKALCQMERRDWNQDNLNIAVYLFCMAPGEAGDGFVQTMLQTDEYGPLSTAVDYYREWSQLVSGAFGDPRKEYKRQRETAIDIMLLTALSQAIENLGRK